MLLDVLLVLDELVRVLFEKRLISVVDNRLYFAQIEDHMPVLLHVQVVRLADKLLHHFLLLLQVLNIALLRHVLLVTDLLLQKIVAKSLQSRHCILMLLALDHHTLVDPLNLLIVLICHINDALEFRTDQLSD